MKLPSIHLNVSSIGDFVKHKLHIILAILVLVIVLLVSWIVYDEIRKVSLATEDNSGITGQIVRVNIGQHQELVKKLDESLKFTPKLIPGNTIFSTAPIVSQ